ncbi:MAG: rhomboid family intramembrane serine protease [Chloroflexota bacterium]|nr:rhomboid family intramembrane serine protease [Dehalococcoidia bacterium]MDW8253908.1 rhomboid family intramembrane serine protease [Chloroflexota bacterium]
MIPVGDENEHHGPAVVTLTLIGLNLAAFFLQLLFGTPFTYAFSFIPAELTLFLLGRAPSEVLITLFTAMFLHASLGHLLGNLLFLWVFGDNVEHRLGSFLFLVFYVVCGLAATFTQYLTDPTSTIPNLGASGAISGVLGAYFVLFPANLVRVFIWPFSLFLGTVPIPALVMLGLWFLLQLWGGVSEFGQLSTGGVAFWAHVGGFVAGMVLGMPFRGRRRRSLPYPPF